ncbi:AAA family ATPase [Salipiger bermudensis]|uniref:AAA family ATPase n=1 Tax=Salipiger bermudensis TaxID=344736 RepID=UPI001C99CCB9|nr:AAA family ATPase [Salipiger bermudensis]MBY6006244.1 AAA family ATPase [Salipiger bermudensis]
MKLRAIELHNVRQFTSPVRIDGIGDGLNVLSEPNEAGKSTLFDALQALFFKPHGSADKETKALRPHAGGAPEIRVELETQEGRFTVAKRWLQKASATVHRDGRLIAQADAAEDWIARALGQDAGGPSGLIWVRQGLTALTDGSKKEKDAALEARRDLLSSVSEEVEAMTGGRRMDAALRRCREELALYATGTGRPKTGGPWKAAQDRVEALSAERDGLAGLTQELHGALAARNRARRTLAELAAPEAAEARRSRLEAARAAHQAATRHAEETEALARKTDMARLTAANAQARLDGLRKALAELAETTTLATQTEGTATQARNVHAEAFEAQARAQTALHGAAEALDRAETERRRAERAQAARDSADRRRDLVTRLKDADRARGEMERAKAAIQGPDAKALQRIEARAADLTATEAARDARATQILMRYADGASAQVKLDGQPLEEGRALPLTRAARLEIDGLGTLEIRPPETGGSDPVEAARAALRNALAEIGAERLEAARAAAAARTRAEQAFGEARAVLGSLAPEGLDALRQQLATLPKAEEAEDAPELASATAAHEAAREEEKARRASLASAAERLSQALSEKTRTETLLAQVSDRLARARAAVEGAESDEATLAAQAEAARQQLLLAEAAQAEKLQSAPDLAAAEAALARAQSVEEQARHEIETLRPELARLEERIARAAGDAVEERLAETEETLAAAQADLARISHEVAALTRLEQALTAARTEARERYFSPVAKELKPLLNLLWQESELTWAEDSLLPDGLVRQGHVEPLDILSGGTQEQVALLVRLAFARMLQAAGRAAPVILDDALVFTDDDRIERMFNALHRQAADLQILVLTCRQRAFRDLGGRALRFQALDETV